MPQRRKLRKLTLPVLPTMFTLANGVCGLGSITLATSHTPGVSTTDLTFYAGLLVFLGMLFDVLDGYVARVTRQTSSFGKELDSLCDMVSFGIAPVFIMLTFADVFQRRLLWGIGVLYAVSAILRLARFNVEKDEHKATNFFRGLPTPAAAGVLASFAIARPALEQLTEPLMAEATQELGANLLAITMIGVPLVTAALAWLMVSRIRYPHIIHELARRRSFSQLVEVVFVLVITVTLHELALPLLFCYFVFAPPINQLRLRAIGKVAAHEAPAMTPSVDAKS
jgi:CDP-diacylglycerol--serine O-phosphatidyltransferase